MSVKEVNIHTEDGIMFGEGYGVDVDRIRQRAPIGRTIDNMSCVYWRPLFSSNFLSEVHVRRRILQGLLVQAFVSRINTNFH